MEISFAVYACKCMRLVIGRQTIIFERTRGIVRLLFVHVQLNVDDIKTRRGGKYFQ